jgi:hypothetical protein
MLTHIGSSTRRLRRSPAAILDPARAGMASVSRLQTEERQMLTIHDQIQQLRAELACCVLTHRERTRAQAELRRLVAEQTIRSQLLQAGPASEAPPD